MLHKLLCYSVYLIIERELSNLFVTINLYVFEMNGPITNRFLFFPGMIIEIFVWFREVLNVYPHFYLGQYILSIHIM